MSHPRGRPATVRWWSAVVVVGLVAASVLVGRMAERFLAASDQVDLGVVQLRVAHNSGAAFSVGAGLPDGVMLGVTAAVTLAVGMYTWRRVPTATSSARRGLVALSAGALANLVDRADDGVVIDYLHTGWWPTFNLPDVLITLGAIALVLAAFRGGREEPDTADDAGTTSAAV